MHLAQVLGAAQSTPEAIDLTAAPTREAKRRGAGWLPGQADIGHSNRLGFFEGFQVLASVSAQGGRQRLVLCAGFDQRAAPGRGLPERAPRGRLPGARRAAQRRRVRRLWQLRGRQGLRGQGTSRALAGRAGRPDALRAQARARPKRASLAQAFCAAGWPASARSSKPSSTSSITPSGLRRERPPLPPRLLPPAWLPASACTTSASSSTASLAAPTSPSLIWSTGENHFTPSVSSRFTSARQASRKRRASTFAQRSQ